MSEGLLVRGVELFPPQKDPQKEGTGTDTEEASNGALRQGIGGAVVRLGIGEGNMPYLVRAKGAVVESSPLTLGQRKVMMKMIMGSQHVSADPPCLANLTTKVTMVAKEIGTHSTHMDRGAEEL